MNKDRLSNIELCRLASILLVMLVHTTKQSLGNEMNFYAFLLEGFSIIGVNVFILITGYFSTTPKKKSLINLAFICLFWMIIKIIIRHTFGEDVYCSHAFFITSSNWFIPSYIGLLFMTPIINAFSETASKRQLGGAFLSLVMFQFWFDLLPPYPKVLIGSQRGFSVFSFCVIYLIGRYLKLYGLPYYFKKNSLVIYIICSCLLGSMSFISQLVGHGELIRLVFAYNNPIVILSSVSFFMIFEPMNISSGIINRIAKSTLGVLLGHTAIYFIYTKQFKYLYDHFSGLLVIVYWALSVLIVFCICIAIDQMRLMLYNLIEKVIQQRIKNNKISLIDDKF